MALQVLKGVMIIAILNVLCLKSLYSCGAAAGVKPGQGPWHTGVCCGIHCNGQVVRFGLNWSSCLVGCLFFKRRSAIFNKNKALCYSFQRTSLMSFLLRPASIAWVFGVVLVGFFPVIAFLEQDCVAELACHLSDFLYSHLALRGLQVLRCMSKLSTPLGVTVQWLSVTLQE